MRGRCVAEAGGQGARGRSRVSSATPPVRTLVVDDSAVVRQIMTTVLTQAGGMRVDTARDAAEAGRCLLASSYDVMLLDVEMPGMSGLAFLEMVMRERPMPVVVCSGHVRAGSDVVMRALAAGAVDVVAKPLLGSGDGQRMLVQLVDTVRAASRARVGGGRLRALATGASDAKQRPVVQRLDERGGAVELVAIGASTGGVEAIRSILTALPADTPPIAIVQHMPPVFTAAFARDLDRDCAVEVREARHGETLRRGTAVIAPGDRHLRVAKRGGVRVAELGDDPPVTRHRPSVDVLFDSVARAAGRTVGVLLTGMGDDGARGLLAMRRGGAATIVQDEGSCVVFGMPAAALALGAATRVLPLQHVARELRQLDSPVSRT